MKQLIVATALTFFCGSALAQNTGPAPQTGMEKPGMTNGAKENGAMDTTGMSTTKGKIKRDKDGAPAPARRDDRKKFTGHHGRKPGFSSLSFQPGTQIEMDQHDRNGDQQHQADQAGQCGQQHDTTSAAAVRAIATNRSYVTLFPPALRGAKAVPAACPAAARLPRP
jgi:hypothetical protein